MVAKDKATGKGRGYAFCTFVHAEDADRALQVKTRSLGVRATGALLGSPCLRTMPPCLSHRVAMFIFRSPLSETTNRMKEGGGLPTHPRALEGVEVADLSRPLRPCCTTP